MKEIIAYIKPHKLPDVTSALRNIEDLTGISIMECKGFGTGWHSAADHADEDLLGYRKALKLEIICRDSVAPAVISTITEAAHTGLKGDGKIYVSNITQAVRIGSGETGRDAV